MKNGMAKSVAIVVVAMLAFSIASRAEQRFSQNAAIASADSHGFDFEFGDWRVHHRVKRPDGQPWLEFDGTCTTRSLMDGTANIEEHKFDKPSGVTRGMALRAYDAKSGQWAIWWVDSRNPHGSLDPPMIGRFENGVGTFYSESLVDGKTIRTRFVWSQIGPTSAHWEQASSADAGTTWETNWIMDFQRAAAVIP